MKLLCSQEDTSIAVGKKQTSLYINRQDILVHSAISQYHIVSVHTS